MDTLPQEGPPAVLDRSGSVDAEETLPQEGPVVVLDSSESEDADLCVLVHFLARRRRSSVLRPTAEGYGSGVHGAC